MFLINTRISKVQASVDSTSSDFLINKARQLAYAGNKKEAKYICVGLLADEEENVDASVFLGRLFSWDQQYDSARAVLKNILENHASYYDALDVMIDIEYWSHHYDESLLYCDLGLKNNPVDANFNIKKAKILISADDIKSAALILEELLKREKNNAEAKTLLKSVQSGKLLNKVGLTYSLDYFVKDSREPWTGVSFQYTRITSLGSLLGRVNYANRFGSPSIQYEVDGYPSLSKRSYGYFNYGYSNSSILPKHRLGADFYYNFHRAYEGSIGFRYMNFSGTQVLIYTAFVGKYLGNYWLSFRIFTTPGANGTSLSGGLLVRKYFSDVDSYLGIRLGYGKSPDDRRSEEEGEYLMLTSQSLRLEYSEKFFEKWIFNISGMYENEEFYTTEFRNIYTLNLSISRLF